MGSTFGRVTTHEESRPMVEALWISAAVATPLGLLGLVAALGYYFYARRLQFEERRLESLPLEERARVADERLSRYGIDGSNLTREDKSRLILAEMEKRHQFARLCTLVLAVVFVICFGVASFTFVYAMQYATDGKVLRDTLQDQKEENAFLRAALLNQRPTPEFTQSIVKWHNEVASSADAQGILLDPSLTDEEKVTQLIVSTANAIDRQIDEQSERLEKGLTSPSVSTDVELMKLKRSIDKREQVFGMMRQRIDAYNQRAKRIIDSMEP